LTFPSPMSYHAIFGSSTSCYESYIVGYKIRPKGRHPVVGGLVDCLRTFPAQVPYDCCWSC